MPGGEGVEAGAGLGEGVAAGEVNAALALVAEEGVDGGVVGVERGGGDLEFADVVVPVD